MSKAFSYRNTSLLVVITLVMASAFLVWYAMIRINDFRAHQLELARQSVDGVASEISSFIREVEREVALFAENNYDLIRVLAVHPEDDEVYAQLKRNVGNFFPDYFAITIADRSGETLLQNFELLVNEVCQRDIRSYIKNDYNYDVYIHPHPDVYHFDIMAPWGKPDGPGGVFFVSFKPRVVARLLGNAQIHQHELLLLKRNIPGLIEVTARGARIDLTELNGNFILDDNAMRKILYRKPVEGTQWDLVDRPTEGLFAENVSVIRNQTILIFTVFALVTLLMYQFVKREEKRRAQSESDLKQARDQLQNTLVFSHVSTWELQLSNGHFSWSNNASEIFANPPPATLHDYYAIIDEQDLADVKRMFTSCKDLAGSCHLEHRILLPGNLLRWVEITGSFLMASSRSEDRMLGLVTDITERKQAEADRLQAEKKHQETLVREVHHRIKNNIQGIVGLLRQHGSRIPDASSVIEQAVSQLYTVSSIYGLQSAEQNGEIRLKDLLREIAHSTTNMTGMIVRIKGLEDCKTNPLLRSDRSVAVALILNELIFNAVKHTPGNAREAVSVRMDCFPDDVRISIQNPGKPLPEGFDFAHKRGLGVGLSLVSSLLPRQGARLELSEQGGYITAMLNLQTPVLKKTHERHLSA